MKFTKQRSTIYALRYYFFSFLKNNICESIYTHIYINISLQNLFESDQNVFVFTAVKDKSL